ncbi:MAG: 50S ribosomal protein L4 [Candidatus Falkowbacteria bacterium]|nr:50S ribosomal protein L4 [Candidatus Falkowbacteria bacterium]
MSVKLNIYNQAAEKTGTIELSEKVFGLAVKEALIHQAVVAQRANQRQVLAHTKDRSEVRGGGRKPWRQKGTGRARVGSSRSPLWRGGGVTFGPTKDRNFKKKLNKKMRQQALCMAITDRMNNKSLVVIDKLTVDDFKTKAVNEMIKKVASKILPPAANKKAQRSILILTDNRDEKFKYSVRNLVGITHLNLENINIIDLLNHKHLILTAGAAKKIDERYSAKQE